MKQFHFGDVIVHESETVDHKPDAFIGVPELTLTVIEAEGFACNLMDAVMKAREIIRDPL